MHSVTCLRTPWNPLVSHRAILAAFTKVASNFGATLHARAPHVRKYLRDSDGTFCRIVDHKAVHVWLDFPDTKSRVAFKLATNL